METMNLVETQASKQPAKSLPAKLQTEAAKNPVFNDVCHILALRKRARQELTLNALYATMKKEGFQHEKTAYQNVLKIMATLGVGTVAYSARGRMIGLKNIKLTLQSIGHAAIASAPDKLRDFKSRSTLPKLATKMPQSVVETPQPSEIKVSIGEEHGSPISLKLPFKLKADEIGEFIVFLYSFKPAPRGSV